MLLGYVITSYRVLNVGHPHEPAVVEGGVGGGQAQVVGGEGVIVHKSGEEKMSN